MYDKPSAPTMKINHRNLIASDCKAFGNKVGVYSNHATVFEAMRGLFTTRETQRQRDEINLRKKLLREIIGAEIDSTKGLEKPKEPARFTKSIKITEDDTKEQMAEKRYHNSLVITKKPYFFRYLYPDLNKQYKRHEAAYNETSKCAFRIKFKKLLVRENKTSEQKTLVRNYHKFSPLINTDCTMNQLCRKFEKLDFNIKYGKNCESMLPYYDLSSYKIDEVRLGEFRKMYQKYSNKKSLTYISYVYDGFDDDDFKEIRFGAIDAIRDELKNKLQSMNLPTLDALTYIKTLSLSYSKFNWAFAWELLEDDILDVIDEHDALAPVEDPNGQEYLGRKFVLRSIPKAEKEKYFNDTEEGVILID